MRYELITQVASSVMHVVRLLQEVVDAPDMQKAGAQPASVHPALGGCVDSPEAATVILMLVGSLGIYYGTSLYLKLARRRQLPSAGM